MAAEAMVDHVNHALKNTLQRLEPYFQMREANGKTYARSTKRAGVAEAGGATSARNGRSASKPSTAND